MPMKIAHLIPALTRGGAEKVAVELANAGVAAGHDVALVAGWDVDRDLLASDLDSRIDFRTMSPAGTGRLARYANALRWTCANRNWLLAQDVVHCHLTLAAFVGTLLGRMRPKRGGPAIVETIHAVGMPIPTLMRRRIAFFASERDGVALMAMDGWWCDFARRHPGVLTRYISNGISRPPVRSPLASLDLPAGAFVIGNVGRLVAERMPHRLVEAFAAGFADDPNAHLVLGGSGPELDSLAAQARALGLKGRVHLPGLVTDVPALLAASELYLSINVAEITGIAGLEAAYAGLPVVALQTVEGRAAGSADWIWSSSDPHSVGTHMAALAADPASRAALAASQQAHVEAHFSADRMLSDYLEFYGDVLVRRRQSHTRQS